MNVSSTSGSLGRAWVCNTLVILPESMVCDEHLCYFLLHRDLSRNNQLQLLMYLLHVNLVLNSMEGGILVQLETFLLQDVLPLLCASVCSSFFVFLD